MVEVIKNSLGRIETRNASNANMAPKNAGKANAPASAKDSVELKSAENMSAIKEMASAAPIDRANVDRIKDAIQRGEYPIDIDRISDALLEAYKEMKTS